MNYTAPCRQCGRSLFCYPTNAQPICNVCLRDEAPEMFSEAPLPEFSVRNTLPTPGASPGDSPRGGAG